MKVSFLKISQPIGEFFVGSIPACTLMDLAYSDVRRLTGESEGEEYSGIQRSISNKRVKEIKNYINTIDSTFPNSIILNTSSDRVKEVETYNIGGTEVAEVSFEDNENTFKIIDGQHRLLGFDYENCKNFDLIITLFFDLVIEDQAYIFSTINSTQTQVSSSLVYDLFDVAETRSPMKTAHEIAKALNSDEESPFYKRIKLIGKNPEVGGVVLYKANFSQGAIVKRVLQLISKDPKSDRDLYKRGEKLDIRGNEMEKGLIFRPFFVRGEDWAIYKVIKNYFLAFQKVFSNHWENPESPFSKTIGFGALIRLLVDIFPEAYKNGDISLSYFEEVFKVVRENYREDSVTLDLSNFPAAGYGENFLYRKLKAWAQVE